MNRRPRTGAILEIKLRSSSDDGSSIGVKGKR